MNGDDRTLSEKRAEAANARWTKHDHPLFMREEGEKATPIAFINVRRYTQNGPVDAPRVWPASELQSDDDIFTYFGGGSYELVARAATSEGKPGARVKTRRMTLEGPSKPFYGEQVTQGAPQPSAQAAGGDMQLYMAMMAEERRDARMREERRDTEWRAAEERRQARDDARQQQTTQLIVQGIQMAAGIVSALLNRPPPPPPPAAPDLMPLVARLIPTPDQTDPLDRLGKVLEIAKKVAPTEKTESTGELLEGLGAAMQGFAQVEGMRQEAAQKGLLHPAPGATPAPATTPQPITNGNAHPTQPAPPPTPEPEGEAASLSS